MLASSWSNAFSPDMRPPLRAVWEPGDIPLDALVIGFVGRLSRDKGVCELYEAHTRLRRQFPSLRLLLVGDFEAGDPLPPQVHRSIDSDSSVGRPGAL
jgi:glycosyltransferase involved in cell wall biosynthesis